MFVRRIAVGCAKLLLVAAAAHAQDPEADTSEAAWRAVYLQEARALELFVRTGDERLPLDFQEQPVMRWVSFNEFNGDVFIWTRDGRPEVIGNIVGFSAEGLASNQRYTLAELHSLSSSPIEAATIPAGQTWRMESGLSLPPIDGAPPPVESERGRLLQARALAREFSARMTHYGEKWELRRLEKPLHEYGAAGSDVLAGALFAFVAFRTDPELLLLIEARSGADGPFWAFLPVRLSQQDLWLERGSKQIWESLMRGPTVVDPKLVHSPYRVYDNKLQTLASE